MLILVLELPVVPVMAFHRILPLEILYVSNNLEKVQYARTYIFLVFFESLIRFQESLTQSCLKLPVLVVNRSKSRMTVCWHFLQRFRAGIVIHQIDC